MIVKERVLKRRHLIWTGSFSVAPTAVSSSTSNLGTTLDATLYRRRRPRRSTASSRVSTPTFSFRSSETCLRPDGGAIKLSSSSPELTRAELLSGASTIKLLRPKFTDFRNKLERLSLASLSRVV